jgi:hypothetical protein
MRLHIRGAEKRKRPEYVKRVLDVDVLPIWPTTATEHLNAATSAVESGVNVRR